MSHDDAPITLDQLEVLAAIADHGSFSAAARALKRAQSAVSYSVATLERQLGLVLFDRSERTPKLTDAGRAILADGRSALRDIDLLRARARSLAHGTEAFVAVAVSALLPMPDLVAAIDAFRSTFPQTQLVLHTEALGGVADLVLNGTCSIGVSEPLPKPLASIDERPLASIAMVHVAAASHPLASSKGPLSRDALERHIQIVLSDRSRLTEGLDFGVLGGPTWRVADLGTKLAFLRAGFGWGGMPLHLVAGDLKERKLCEIRPADRGKLPREVPLYAIHRTSSPPGPAARWLLERLARSCAVATTGPSTKSRAGSPPHL